MPFGVAGNVGVLLPPQLLSAAATIINSVAVEIIRRKDVLVIEWRQTFARPARIAFNLARSFRKETGTNEANRNAARIANAPKATEEKERRDACAEFDGLVESPPGPPTVRRIPIIAGAGVPFAVV